MYKIKYCCSGFSNKKEQQFKLSTPSQASPIWWSLRWGVLLFIEKGLADTF
jgi:hypothetical protein